MALTFSITGGADATKFSIGATTGVLAFKAAPDFEAPGDADTNNVYIVEVGVSDGTSTTKQTISVTVTDVPDSNLPPQITSPATKTVNENSTAVMTVTATDPDEGTPPPVTTGSIPLSYNDARFASNQASGAVQLSGGQTLADKSITSIGGSEVASIWGVGPCTVRKCRVNSREALRVGSAGAYVIENSYLESLGQGADHADTIQAYAPDCVGSITMTDVAVVAHNVAATAGMFIADGWSGSITMTNVMFNGGPYGLRIHADGGNITLRMKDIFFVGPFAYGRMILDLPGASVLNITQWENVRDATIVNGVLVPGAVINQPAPAAMSEETKKLKRPPKPKH